MPTRIGPYHLEREIGRGGMGVVYLGHDPRLDRAVAIKALPEHLASDPDRLARFTREARTLAQLSHPNVAGIFGVEEHDGASYLVLEYVEGETLADRLARGPLPVDEALEIAGQIAAGVEAAHDAGIVHRDLKPGNVIVTPGGKAKLLDFGLARTHDPPPSSVAGPAGLTVTSPAVEHSPTIPGVILGTAAYMSPEQARGQHTLAWSPDGRDILFYERADARIRIVPVDGSSEAAPLTPPIRGTDARFTPDGRWLVFVSSQSGLCEATDASSSTSRASGSLPSRSAPISSSGPVRRCSPSPSPLSSTTSPRTAGVF